MYSNKNEAIQNEIIRLLKQGAVLPEDYDLEKISNKVLGDESSGFMMLVSTSDFWEVVVKNRKKNTL